MFNLIIPMLWMNAWTEATLMANGYATAAWAQMAQGKLPTELVSKAPAPERGTEPLSWCYQCRKPVSVCGHTLEGSGRAETGSATGTVPVWG